MKKFIAMGSMLVLMLGCVLGFAACGDSDGAVSNCRFDALEDGSGYALTGFSITATFGKVPEEIRLPDTNQGKPVSVLGNGQRAIDVDGHYFEVKRIVIPSSVTYIRAYAFGRHGNKENPIHEFVLEGSGKVCADIRSMCNRITDEYVKLPGFTIVCDEDAGPASEAYKPYVCIDCPNLKTLDLSDCKFEGNEVDLDPLLNDGKLTDGNCPQFKNVVLPGKYSYQEVYLTAANIFVKGTAEDTPWEWDPFYFRGENTSFPNLYWYSETQPDPDADEGDFYGIGYWRYVDGVPQVWE